jgi:hypothetical protein
MLADEQVALGVVDHAVAFITGSHHLLHPVPLAPTAAHIARHVAEEKELVLAVPDRALGEGEAGGYPLHLGRQVDQVRQLLRLDLDSHGRPPSRLARCTGPAGGRTSSSPADY